jgi:cytochrome P450
MPLPALLDLSGRVGWSPGLLSAAIDEVICYSNQTTRVSRRSVRPVSIEGHLIPSGRPASSWLAVANRDPRKFDDPNTFRPGRSPNYQLAWVMGSATVSARRQPGGD